MIDRTYKYQIENNIVEVTKSYRNRTQFEWILNIFMSDGETESIHLFNTVHLTRKSALSEAKRAILNNPPRIERVF